VTRARTTLCLLVALACAAAGPAVWAQVPVKTQKTFAECVADPKPYLAMDWKNFDQGVAPDGREWGWREVSSKPGCETAAADLMAMWMKEKGATLDARTRTFMTFHEGQVRAMGGDFRRGAEMIEAGRFFWDNKPEGAAYVDAILAFLRGDRAGLLAARERMMAIPEPANFARTQKAFREQAGWEPKWPMNIEAVDKMIGCWGKGYTGGSRGDCDWRPAQ